MTTPTEVLPALKEQLSVLLTEREIAETQLQIDQITKLAEQGRIVLEAHGDWVNPQEYLQDDPTFGFGGRHISPISRIDDRTDGRYRPIFETETDLAMIRGAARVIAGAVGTGINILENLTNYTVGSGFTFEAKPVKDAEVPAGLVNAVQRVIDTFLGDNNWQSDLERERHSRSREDGEAAMVLWPRGWRTEVNVIEPDQILQPANSSELDRWLHEVGNQIGSDVSYNFVPSWAMGVHTRKNNPSHPLGYHAVFDGSGNDWNYFPTEDVKLAKRIGSGVMEFIKRNTPMNVGRGVSDFYPVTAKIERAEKLSTNVEVTAAIQAAIAFIRNHPKSTTQAQITSLQSGLATGTVNRSAASGGTRTVQRQKFQPGTIIDTNGSEYHAGPMGQSNAPTFIDVIQSALRGTGARWCMPEYMISSDASNNNFASILVAGSPFVQARYADQRFYVSRDKRMIWKVVRIAYEGGFFDRFHLAWDQMEALIDILVTAPDITIADELKNAQVKELERAAGVLSAKTWIKESGRDVEEEEKNLAEERANGIGPAAAGGGIGQGDGAGTSVIDSNPINPEASGEYKDLSRRQWQRNIKAIDDVLAGVIAGTRTELMATEMLITLGLDRDRAKAFILDAKDNGKVDDPEFVAAAQESLARDHTAFEFDECEPIFFFESFDSSQPRGDDGKWVDGGSISAAIGNPEKIAALRAKVTNPEQRAKLDKKLGSSSKSNKGKSSKLSTKETNAIQDYTTDKFRTINKALRDGGELDGDTKAIVSSIDSALEKAPKHEGTTFRKFTPSDPAAYIEQLQPGKVFSDTAYVSTSKDTPRFIPGGSIALQVIGKNGVDISSISLHGKSEKEVLFPRGTKFKVLKAKQHDQGGWVAIVQEIEGSEIGESLVESFYFPDYYDLPPGMTLLQESAYVAALETATPEERAKLLERAWEAYP